MNTEVLSNLSMFASALARRSVSIDAAEAGQPTWTNGQVIFVNGDDAPEQQLQAICVQSALLAAGSFNRNVLQQLRRRPKVAKRYLAIEGHRALAELGKVTPACIRTVINQEVVTLSNSATASLQIALQRQDIAVAPLLFGTIRIRELLAADIQEGGAAENSSHIPRQQASEALTEIHDEDSEDDEDADDFASSPVGGGGGIGKLLQNLFQMVRRVKSGDGPGADAPTHWSRSGPRAGVRALHSTATAETVTEAFGAGAGTLYPEWDTHRQCYRPDWCTVLELNPSTDVETAVAWLDGYALRKPLSRLGMGLDRVRRQRQGDDIDIDAAIEARVGILTGAAADQSVYIESQRLRRDLSVLILLDISGSVAQAGTNGLSVHEQQRTVAASLATVLYEVGDRLALYAFHSQGRSAVHLIPVKRFDDNLDSAAMSRLHSLKPGAYSRLGAAIRHCATELVHHSGTERQLLVVLSDGLAYDHGYEPEYGAADARQALGEARRDGVGCLCLSVGAGTDTAVLRQVFGSAAHATIPAPEDLGQIIGPLFHAALRNAEVQKWAA